MIDFSSASYLGFRHRREDLAAWPSLTLGKPPALAESAAARRLAAGLVKLTGLPDAVLGASTLHLFWDLFAAIGAERPSAFFVEEGLYPVARWGLERVAPRALVFRRHDAGQLGVLLRRHHGARPVVVCDGWCPAKGAAAPLALYQAASLEARGLLVVDDTQALGVLGERRSAGMPWGFGGSSVLFHRLRPENLLWAASLAKGFGAPLAALLGPRDLLDGFRKRSLTRVHCGGPSEASVAAGIAALLRNESEGESRRLALAQRVGALRDGLRRLSIPVAGGFFPYLTALVDDAESAHRHLLRRGIATVLHRHRETGPACLTLLCRADHGAADIDHTLEALGAWQQRNRRSDHERRIRSGRAI
jgi:8-amino-7-oxononanoate synthase